MNIKQSNLLIHFVGIGGIGMSGIAEILLQMGYRVSGSDISPSANTEKLEKLGAKIFIGHKPENVEDVSIIVFSSAIKEDNPEYMMAKVKNIPIMKRAEMLAELMRIKKGVAVAGTHGKTTTTSMLATIMQESDYSPTYIIGGIVNNLKGHANIGKGEYLVAEADESDGSFLLLNPLYSIITNIDDDHLDHYGSRENIFEAFKNFSNKVPFYGCCALNFEDPKNIEISKKIRKPYVSFGFESDIEKDYEARDISIQLDKTSFTLFHKGENIGEAYITLPGVHNVLNALGAIAIAHQMDIPFEKILRGIEKFEGVGRRFQKLFEEKDFEVIDDYGHHPTEIAKTIKALRDRVGDKKVIAFFEPHRFTRTRDCWDQFLHCFNYADKVYVGPIYSASESPIPGISSTRLVSDINKLHPGLCETLDTMEEMETIVNDISKSSVSVITLGAGSIGRKIRDWVITKSKI